MAGQPAARRILLVRHGHYERTGNLGDEVWSLSALGRRQAARTGRRLARLIPSYPGRFEGIYSSPWPRALQTAEICAHEMDIDRVRIKEYLHEAVPLVPEDESGRSVHPDLPVTSEEERDATVEQVERIRARFFQPSKRNTTYLIFCHGNLIRYLVAATLGLPYEAWMRMDVNHASLSEIHVYPGDFTALISYNESGHLPPGLRTT